MRNRKGSRMVKKAANEARERNVEFNKEATVTEIKRTLARNDGKEVVNRPSKKPR